MEAAMPDFWIAWPDH